MSAKDDGKVVYYTSLEEEKEQIVVATQSTKSTYKKHNFWSRKSRLQKQGLLVMMGLCCSALLIGGSFGVYYAVTARGTK